MSLRIAVSYFSGPDDVARSIHLCLERMGYAPYYLKSDERVPDSADVVFTYAPWGRLQQITHRLANMPSISRPAWAHLSTEDPPDLRMPWFLLLGVGRARAWIDRFHDSGNSLLTGAFSWPVVDALDQRLHKFRYVGEYHYACKAGLLTVLADISKVYADFYTSNGLQVLYTPWGMPNDARSDLILERDIDVLWLGTRRTRRRSMLLDKIRADLVDQGVNMLVIDGVENPPVHGPKRNEILTRSKITLNLLPTWYDNTLVFRFPYAAANKSMVISESSLDHCPAYRNGVHFVAVPSDQIVSTILYYLDHDAERNQIADEAFRLVTEGHGFCDSVASIMEALCEQRPDLRP